MRCVRSGCVVSAVASRRECERVIRSVQGTSTRYRMRIVCDMQSVMIVVEALFVVSSAFAKVRSVLATAPAPATSAERSGTAPRAGVECGPVQHGDARVHGKRYAHRTCRRWQRDQKKLCASAKSLHHAHGAPEAVGGAIASRFALWQRTATGKRSPTPLLMRSCALHYN
mgnify:CR=1 FL=1